MSLGLPCKIPGENKDDILSIKERMIAYLEHAKTESQTIHMVTPALKPDQDPDSISGNECCEFIVGVGTPNISFVVTVGCNRVLWYNE